MVSVVLILSPSQVPEGVDRLSTDICVQPENMCLHKLSAAQVHRLRMYIKGI